MTTPTGPEAVLPPPTSPNPLAQAKVDSLTELLSRDPLELARDPAKRREIVEILRARRTEFAKKEAEEGAKPRKGKGLASAIVPPGELNFDDL